MSSPIHQAEDLDPALRYAPRWARDRVSPLPGRPLAPSAARPMRRARPEFSGDRAIVELQRQLILDPDAIMEPVVDDARTLRPIVLRFSAVMGLAALIAWVVVSLPSMKRAGEIMPADVNTPALAVNPVKLVQVRAPETAPQGGGELVAMTDPAPPVSAPPAPPPTQPIPVVAPPAAAPATAAPTPPAAAPLHIDNAEIATMIKRGKDLLMSGDIISARLLLRRAADAGSAEAALALGATFDPLVIARLGAIGMPADIAQARQWYQRAAELGSAAATGQLAKLEQAR
jgi:Sel1 repeat